VVVAWLAPVGAGRPLVVSSSAMASPADDRHLLWAETSRELLLRCPVFDLYRTERRSPPAGPPEHVGSFYVLDVRHWVSVVPVVKNDQGADAFLMVRQYRHGIDRITLEFPAGLVDAGEPPERAAARELVEETGYLADTIIHAATMAAAPALMNNSCYIYVATELGKRREQALDETERLEVVTVPVDEVAAGMGSGELINSVTAVSLYYYLRLMGRSMKGETGADRSRTGA
jgi:ADP-ribose pyrophosphatase